MEGVTTPLMLMLLTLAPAGLIIALILLAQAVKALREIAEIMAMSHAAEIDAFKSKQAALPVPPPIPRGMGEDYRSG